MKLHYHHSLIGRNDVVYVALRREPMSYVFDAGDGIDRHVSAQHDRFAQLCMGAARVQFIFFRKHNNFPRKDIIGIEKVE